MHRSTAGSNKRMVGQLVERGALRSKRIIAAFVKTDRRAFVPKAYAAYAYQDTPLPTVGESTISEPYTVAVMAELINPKAGDKILEVGTGSGYNASILAACVGADGKVISMEVDRKVAEFAKHNIRRTRKRVTVVEGDGSHGYPKSAPYDGIIYTCAIPAVPRKVLEQLKIGGIALAPVGGIPQVLTLIRRISKTEFEKNEMGHFLFVPIKSPH